MIYRVKEVIITTIEGRSVIRVGPEVGSERLKILSIYIDQRVQAPTPLFPSLLKHTFQGLLKAYPLAGTLRCSFLLPLPHLFPVQCPQTGDPARRRTQQTDLLSGLNQQQLLILPHLDLF